MDRSSDGELPFGDLLIVLGLLAVGVIFLAMPHIYNLLVSTMNTNKLLRELKEDHSLTTNEKHDPEWAVRDVANSGTTIQEHLELPVLVTSGQKEPFRCEPITSAQELLDFDIHNQDLTITELDSRRFMRRKHGKILLCHDMKGGYLSDASQVGAIYDDSAFQFWHWELVDSFCYFSHNLVTIPPIAWINLCHRQVSFLNQNISFPPFLTILSFTFLGD